MKNKRSSKQLYQDTFDQIKLSDEGYRQIRNMEESTMIHFDKQTKKRLGFRAAISLAALTVVLLSANGIAYAATGSTLIEQVAGHVSVYIDGKPYDSAKVTKFKDKNGNTNYEVSVDEKSSSCVTMEIEEPATGNKKSNDAEPPAAKQENDVKEEIKEETQDEQENLKTSVKQVNDTVYLVIEGISEKPVQVDITQDYADGNAEGTIQIEKADYLYKVSGTLEEYTIDLEKR